MKLPSAWLLALLLASGNGMAQAPEPQRPSVATGASAPDARQAAAGENSLSGMTVHQDEHGRWLVTVDYVYSGQPVAAMFYFVMPGKPMKTVASLPAGAGNPVGPPLAKRGRHRVVLEIFHPGDTMAAMREVRLEMVAMGQTIASAQKDVHIVWGDFGVWANRRELAGMSNEEVLTRAIKLIDGGDRMGVDSAKRMLEHVLTKDPRNDPAYIELARVAMRLNWGPEGLQQARSLLDSALQIRPDSANARILLGYVLAHQGKHQAAEALLAETAKVPQKNLWLWTNWGEVLAMQGKHDLALEKYRRAVSFPPTGDTYDRARMDAYRRLLRMHKERDDVQAMEAMHKQRLADYGPSNCHGAEYAWFLLVHRGDIGAAIEQGRAALASSCDDFDAREVLGMAYYARWADIKQPARQEALHQARVFLPSGPRQLYLLATSERTGTVIPLLLAQGEAIDQQDNEKFNALTYALRDRDVAAVGRLLKHGARVDSLIGPRRVPVSLIPVFEADVPAVQLFRRAGVDYRQVRFEGITGVDLARRIGDRKLMDAIDRRGSAL